MKKSILYLIIIILLSSCATVKFYNDSILKNETGIEFFSAKPYLLIEKQPAKDVSMKATIIYLPDRSKPMYAKLQSGFGSSNLQLSLSNGIITSYGITADSKIPETITAMTGVLTSSGAGYKSYAEAIDILKKKDQEGTVEEAGDVSSMQKADTLIMKIVGDLEKIKNSELLTSNQKETFQGTLDKLKMTNTKINSYEIKDIPNIGKEIDEEIKTFSSIEIDNDSESSKNFKSKLSTLIKELNYAKELMIPKKKASESTFELYEIVIKSDKTELIKVKLPYEL